MHRRTAGGRGAAHMTPDLSYEREGGKGGGKEGGREGAGESMNIPIAIVFINTR